MRWRPAPASQGFLRSGTVVWARADGPSMAQRRSLGIHAERPTPRHLRSASRRASGCVLKIAALQLKPVNIQTSNVPVGAPEHREAAMAVSQTGRHRCLALLGSYSKPPRANPL